MTEYEQIEQLYMRVADLWVQLRRWLNAQE